MRRLATQNTYGVPSFWHSVMDASHNGIVIINREGTILLYNQAARRMLGGGDESPIGRHFSEIRPENWHDLKSIIESGRPQIGRKIALPNATIIANRNPILIDGQVAGVVSVFQDISEYEAIISGLQGYQKLHRELEAIFESSYDGLYITDGKANTIRINSAYERITGLKREDLIGRNMRDLVNEEVFDHSVTLEVLSKRGQVSLMQKIMGYKHVLVTGTPIFDDEGKIALVVTNVRDMTMLSELRAQLEESRQLSSRYRQSLVEKEKFRYALEEMVVKSSAMIQTVRKAVKAAEVDVPVLLHGESGVGKSMLARIIHLMSPRKERPFIKINCGAIPASLIESELFGYARGAFTGASPEGKAGLIEAGHTGTVLLDEVGELTPEMQVKLLHVIEDKTFTRLGGTRASTVDVRIIAATNRDPKEMGKKGAFGEDLYYRLNVIPIFIPPLRDRREDITALALNILERFNRTGNLTKRLAPAVLDRLIHYNYPGNVRELANIMERMIILSEGNEITLADIPGELYDMAPVPHDPVEEGLSLKTAVESLERGMITGALRHYKSLSMAARALGVHPTTLWRKMTRHGISGSGADKQ